MNHSGHTFGMSDHTHHTSHMHNHSAEMVGNDGAVNQTDSATQMNHMDHSSSHMMMMVFHFGYNEVILFEFWKISSVEGLVASMVIIFFLSLFYEALKYFREHLFRKNYTAMQYRTVQGPNNGKPADETRPRVVNLVPEVGHRLMPTLFSKHHIFQTFLQIIQVALSYVLMLIFMIFNAWLCIAVVAGDAVGYFLFGWKKALFVDITEHCH